MFGLRFVNDVSAVAPDVTALIEVFAVDSYEVAWAPPVTIKYDSAAKRYPPRPDGDPVNVARFGPGDRIATAPGRWRELDLIWSESPVARGITFGANRQQHGLDVLVQERPATRLDAGWYLATDPIEHSLRDGPPLHPGTYRLEILLIAPTLAAPTQFTFRLTIPPDYGSEASATLPQVVRT